MRPPHILIALAALALPGCGEARQPESGNAAAAASMAPLPALTGRVVDGAEILSETAEATLTSELAGLEERTSDQLVVLTVASLNGEPIERFGLRVGNGWGIGRKDRNNGVLLIVAPNDRKVRIEVGRGLETTLTNLECAGIIERDILPHFQVGRFEQGVEAGIAALVRRLDEAGQIARKAA